MLMEMRQYNKSYGIEIKSRTINVFIANRF